MAKGEIKVTGKRREAIDVKKLAEALLDYIEHLSDAERQKLAAAGERALKQRAPTKRTRGDAA